MIKDIEFPENKFLQLAVTLTDGIWEVILLNYSELKLKYVLVASTGYGYDSANQKIQTSTLRHFFEEIEKQNFQTIEKIDESILHLTNEYWVSYWINEKLYDRCFLFVPESITEKNFVDVPLLNLKAVLHP